MALCVHDRRRNLRTPFVPLFRGISLNPDSQMSEKAPPVAAAAAASSNTETDGLHGSDIAQGLQSTGPVVKCVVLRHMRPSAKDVKPHPVNSKVDETHKRQVLTELIDEILVDTTPSKNAIRQLLGPFTFIGQFPTEGVVAMAGKDIPEDLTSLSIKELRALCGDFDIDTSSMLEKNELVRALEAQQQPVNPHKLQPPLDDLVVRGDIILLKVAETDEVLDEPGGEEKEMKVLSNEEFFLNYTKEEWIAFASRTDVVAPQQDGEEEDDSEGSEEKEEEEEEEEAFEGEDDVDDEEKAAMLNLIMAEVLRKFRDEKGRGPTSEELLQIRQQVAEPLGLDVTTLGDISSKRLADDEDESRSPKRVKFTGSTNGGDEGATEAENEEEDKKPAAVDKHPKGTKKES